MKRIRMISKLTAALIVIGATAASAAETGPDATKHGPPPEAFTACEGKQTGESSKFTDHRGETLIGTCEREGERLVLRPERNRGQAGDRHQGPPAEAYAACQGRKAGESSKFVDPRGETLTGLCEQEGERLVLRPDRAKQGGRGNDSKGPGKE